MIVNTITGVGAHLSAAHRDIDSGKLHGHTWEIVAWFPYKPGVNALDLQVRLKKLLAEWDHDVIPDRLATAEELAIQIGFHLMGCVAVDVSRRSDRLFARWAR